MDRLEDMMNKYDQQWNDLVRAARRAPVKPLPDAAPYAFSSRVVAQWKQRPAESLLNVWRLVSLRVLAFGCGVMLCSLAASYGTIEETLLAGGPDPALEVVELTGDQLEEVWVP